MRFLIFLFTIMSCTPALAARIVGQSALATTAAMSVSVTSSTADIQRFEQASMSFIWYGGGSPVGSIKLQGSNQPVVAGSTGPASWTDLMSSTASIAAASVAVSGNSGSYVYSLSGLGFRWLRGVYTATSGNGSLDINFMGKGN